MPDISVPRQISPLLTSAELHIFTDASISAFSAVIYARQPPSDTTPARLVFVLGRSRVAPIKQRSVPKLELEASVLGIRLLRTVLNAFEFFFGPMLRRVGLDPKPKETKNIRCSPSERNHSTHKTESEELRSNRSEPP